MAGQVAGQGVVACGDITGSLGGPVVGNGYVARRPRIVDVAARAGVSPQTVSNVINSRAGFSDETRDRVLAAIADLGFQPNRHAQSLRSRRTQLVGYDISGEQLLVSNPYTISFMRALVHAAAGHGYRVIALAHETSGLEVLRESIGAGMVDGFVISDAEPGDERAKLLNDSGMPFAVFGRTAVDLPQAWVDIDNYVAIRHAVDHLVGAGHRRFAYVGYPQVEYWNAERYAGARDRLAHHGFALEPGMTVFGDPVGVVERVRSLLAGPDRPEAVVTSSDSLAVAVANMATSLGLQVGRDIAITGFDAGPLRTMVHPTLTSVALPVDVIATALFERLVEEMNEPTGRPGTMVDTALVVGGSA